MSDCTKDRYVQATLEQQADQRERDLQVLRRRVQAFDAEAQVINQHNERTTRRTDNAVEAFFVMVVAVALASIALVLLLS